jgi:hypothetical protein
MDLPLLLSGFSSLLTAFVVASIWATRRPAASLRTRDVMIEAPAHTTDESSGR